MKTPVKIGLAVAITVPILAAAAVHLFVHADRFRPMIESRVSAALSRKVTLGDISLSVMTGSLVAEDLAIAEDPKFGQAPFFTAKRLRIGVEMRSLIFHRELVVRSFEVEAPEIHLVRSEDGTWNYSTVGHGSEKSAARSGMPDLPVGLIAIKDGTATMETHPLQRSAQVYDHLDVKVERFSLAKGFAFRVSSSLPGEGKVKVAGTVGPIDAQNAAATTFDAEISITHFDPVAAGYVDPATGISMIADLDAHTVSDGVNVSSEGRIHAEQLILLKAGKAAPHPVNVKYQVRQSLKDGSGEVSDLALQTGAVAVHIKGTYKLAANVPVFDLKLAAEEVPINSLEALLPAVGVKLPNGTSLKGGTLTAHFGIKGSEKDNVIVGSYEIKHTELVGYNLGSKIVGIAALGGIKTGDSTAIEVSRANVRITKAGSEDTNIYSVLPALGESTGSGTVSASGALNFNLISKVTRAKGLNKVGIDLLTKLNRTSAGAKPSAANGIPIHISGTAENPVITADVSGLMKGNAAALKSKGADILQKTRLSNLLGKKNKAPSAGPGER